MSFGKNLIQIRKQRGITRKELAEKLQIPYSTLRNYEKDQREPGHKILIELSQILSISVDELIGNHQQRTTPELSEEALQIAIAFDRADEKIKHIVRVALEPTSDPAVQAMGVADPWEGMTRETKITEFTRQLDEEEKTPRENRRPVGSRA